MRLKHILKLPNGRILKSIFEDNGFELTINVKSLDVYNSQKAMNYPNQKSYAELFEKYRQDIDDKEFLRTFHELKDQIYIDFTNQLELHAKMSFIYIYSSENKNIRKVLENIKSMCLEKFNNEGKQYINISSCLRKKSNAPKSDDIEWGSLLDWYVFNPNILHQALNNLSCKSIKHLILIDDVIASGKTISALIKNLYDEKMINSKSILDFYCIYNTIQSDKIDISKI